MKKIYGLKSNNLEIDYIQSEVVKKIFKLYLSGESLGGITKYLEENCALLDKVDSVLLLKTNEIVVFDNLLESKKLTLKSAV